MILFPAIDLKDGRCVRLKLGDMNQATMLNIENSFKDVALGNDVTEEAIKSEALKYKIKADKINQKSQEQIDSV